MKNIKYKFMKILPSILFSITTGIVVGVTVFFFKYFGSKLINYSGKIYEYIRTNKEYIPLLFLGLIALSCLSFLIVKFAKYAKGGGIPSSLGIIRGIIRIPYVETIIGTILASFISFFSGVPLGNEGPSVMVGTLLGGVTSRVSKSEKAWNRYIMTSGASAGFAVATSAPLTGIFFTTEEGHRKITPTILFNTIGTVLVAMLCCSGLDKLMGVNSKLFEIENILELKARYFYIPLLIGILIALSSFLYSKLFVVINKINSKIKIPLIFKFMIIFILTGILGIFSSLYISTGHNVIEDVIRGDIVISFMVLLLFLRTIMLLLTNNTGVTGGMFIPSLAVGALLGGIFGRVLINIGIPSEYYIVIVIISMTSFLAATQKIPLTAMIFSIETLGGLSNILFIGLGVLVSYMIIVSFDIKSINNMVLENRLEEFKTKKRYMCEATFRVGEDAFAIGKSSRDILWPPSSILMSISYKTDNDEFKNVLDKDGSKTIWKDDCLVIRFESYDISESLSIFNCLLGDNLSQDDVKII